VRSAGGSEWPARHAAGGCGRAASHIAVRRGTRVAADRRGRPVSGERERRGCVGAGAADARARVEEGPGVSGWSGARARVRVA